LRHFLESIIEFVAILRSLNPCLPFDQDSKNVKWLLAPVVFDDLVKQHWVLHKLVQRCTAIEPVVVRSLEFIDQFIKCDVARGLDYTKHAVGHYDLPFTNEILGIACL